MKLIQNYSAMWPSVTNATFIHKNTFTWHILNNKTYTTVSIVINEMISMHIEECQASELRRQRITAQSPRFSRWMQKDKDFGSNPSLDPNLSCAYGLKRQLIVEGRLKLKHLNLCIEQNTIQLRIEWTIVIVMKYHSKLFIIWI